MNKRLLYETLGYVSGGILFVLLVPAFMWLCSSCPSLLHDVRLVQYVAAIILSVAGLALSIWTIVYMQRVGCGNPMDAFGHSIASQTKHLMTRGPYRICRNPMLLDIFIYDIGFCILFWTWQALGVFLLFAAIMLIQVLSEEKRLRSDFGDNYEQYCSRTGRFLPFSIKMKK